MSEYADPWATDTNPENPQHEAPFDPFAQDVEDVSGGKWENKHGFPSIGQLAQNGGHLVILEPVGFEANRAARKAGDPAKDSFDVKLYVLAGPGTQIERREKNENTGKFEGTGVFYGIGDGTEYPWPIAWTAPTVEIRQTILVGQLRHKFDTAQQIPINGGLWVGRLRLVPHGRLPKQLQSATSDELDAAARAFRAGTSQLDVRTAGIKLMNATSEEKAKARTYWQSIGR